MSISLQTENPLNGPFREMIFDSQTETDPIQYTWSSTYERLPFCLSGRKSIWSYVGDIFINSIFLTFLIFIITFIIYF
jgi:hypothetical protein